MLYATLRSQILSQTPADFSIGDIRWKIAAEWLENRNSAMVTMYR